MTSENIETQDPSYFGKYQRYVTIGTLICYQLLIVPWAFFILYALLTFNLSVLTLIALICVLQFPFRKSSKFISFVNKYIQPTKYCRKFIRISEEKIPDKEKNLYCYHPHSIFSYSILLNMNRGDQQIPDFIGLGSRFGFNAPILGLILRLWGCSTVYKQNLKSLMIQQKNVGVVVGGYQQATLTTSKQMRFYLKKRKGFVKYALRYGYTIRPVICIGQNKAFETFDGLKSIRLFLNKFKIPAAFFINKKYLCFIDPDIQITTIFGKGIKRQNASTFSQPTKQEINHYHQLYIQEISRLYDKYKHLNDNKPLVIF